MTLVHTQILKRSTTLMANKNLPYLSWLVLSVLTGVTQDPLKSPRASFY